MPKWSYKHLIAFIYAAALFLDRMDLTVVNVTLPTVAKVFHVPLISTDWVNLSFLLALALSMPLSHWMAQKFGFKTVYIGSLFLFAIGSSLCAFSSNFLMLIIFRFIHGVGGGLLVPVGMAMLYKVFDKSEHASITSYTFLPSLVAPAIAPFFGGLLLDYVGWRWVFLFSGPICLVLVLIAIGYLKDTGREKAPALDYVGLILTSSLLIDVFYVLSEIGRTGFSMYVGVNALLLVLLISAFISWEKRVSAPLIPLHYFKNYLFMKANVTQFCFQICHFGAIFLLSLYLQIGIGHSASIAGLIMGMQALGAMAVSRYSVYCFNTKGPAFPVTVGFAGLALLTPCVLWLRGSMIFPALLLFFVRGLCNGLCGLPIQTLGAVDIAKKELGSAMTVYNVCRQVAISFGVALSSVLLAWGLRLCHLKNAVTIPAHYIFPVFSAGFFAISIAAIMGIFVIRY